jgi:threonine aldolase
MVSSEHINTEYGVHVNGLRLAEMLPAAGLLREQLASNGCLSRCDVMEVCATRLLSHPVEAGLQHDVIHSVAIVAISVLGCP